MASEVPPKPKMVVYGGKPPGPPRGPAKTKGGGGWWRRRPRWLKITLSVFAVLLVLSITVAAAGAWYLNGVYTPSRS